MEIAMKKLIKAGLAYSPKSLVRLNELQTARYMECLQAMGVEPTRHKTIQVDGAGWSPEVYEAKDDMYYMCVTEINPFGILVSPEQFYLPPYAPQYSWVRAVMNRVVRGQYRTLVDILTTHAVGLEFNNFMDTLDRPSDLCLLHQIEVVMHYGSLRADAETQKKLIAEASIDLNSLEQGALDSLISSAETSGDLRKRSVQLTDVTFDDFEDFYTVACGGVWVFRNVGGRDVVICRKEETWKSMSADEHTARIYFVDNEKHKAFKYLLEQGLIHIPHQRYKDEPKYLDEKARMLLLGSIAQYVDGDVLKLTHPQIQKLLREHKEVMPSAYTEIQRYAASLRCGSEYDLTDVAKIFLSEPNPERVSPDTENVLWTFLVEKDPRNVLMLYTHDKNAFFAQYNTWSESKQQWAVSYLQERYVPLMNRRGV
jgi:hypothetical protein